VGPRPFTPLKGPFSALLSLIATVSDLGLRQVTSFTPLSPVSGLPPLSSPALPSLLPPCPSVSLSPVSPISLSAPSISTCYTPHFLRPLFQVKILPEKISHHYPSALPPTPTPPPPPSPARPQQLCAAGSQLPHSSRPQPQESHVQHLLSASCAPAGFACVLMLPWVRAVVSAAAAQQHLSRPSLSIHGCSASNFHSLTLGSASDFTQRCPGPELCSVCCISHVATLLHPPSCP
jgi:hypothetical protein